MQAAKLENLKAAYQRALQVVSDLKPHVFPFLLMFLMLASMRTASASQTSTNWAGYMIRANGVTGVSASWTIPSISSCVSTVGGTEVTQGISVWIGFDGWYSNAIPEQIGSTSECYNGSPAYYSWEEDPTIGVGEANHEMIAIREALSAGDHIAASIEYEGNNLFQLKIADSDVSQSRTFTVIIPNAPRGSVEWITETFTNTNTQSQVSLPTFQPITFNDCSASVNNVAGSIIQYNGQPINMVDNEGNILVTTQNLNQAGTSFQVAEVASPTPEFPNMALTLAIIFGVLIILKKRITRVTPA
jgi:hypothetical protein